MSTSDSQAQSAPHRVLIAGATGYVGSRLVRRLIGRGHTVRALVRAANRPLAARCEVVTGDALEGSSFTAAAQGMDTLVHLVGVAHPSPSKAALFESVDLASALVAARASMSAGVRHIVYISVARPAPGRSRSCPCTNSKIRPGRFDPGMCRTCVDSAGIRNSNSDYSNHCLAEWQHNHHAVSSTDSRTATTSRVGLSMADGASRRNASWEPDAVHTTVVRLAQEASVELNVQDIQHLGALRELLRPDTRVYVSHLPKQAFRETLSVCTAVRSAGFEAIPHVPVRLFESHAQLSGFIDEAVDRGVNEALLISGDYARARGPFSCVADVLREVDLRASGWKRISFGGHPEGHPKVDSPTIRAAELEKARLAQSSGMHATFVTQFFFEADPFLKWSSELRSAGRPVAIRAGLAGPASVTTLFRFAVRCGVGPSIKALNTRPGSFTRLLAEHGPEEVLTRLAADESLQASRLDGIHLFCFGGVIRTCRWLNQLASGQIHTERGWATVSGLAGRRSRGDRRATKVTCRKSLA